MRRGSVSDTLIVDGGAIGGTTGIRVLNKGGAGGKTINGIPVVLLRNGAISPADAFFLSQPAVAGLYEYRLVQNPTDHQWYLSTLAFRPEIGSYLGNIYAATHMFQHSLYDRQGMENEPRRSRTWIRTVGNDWKREALNGALTMRSKDVQLQAGIDVLATSFGSNDSLYAGLMGGYGHAWSRSSALNNVRTSKGSVDAYALGVYASWFEDDVSRLGAYADSWMQYGWQNNAVNGQHLDEKKYNSNTFSASLELGYAFALRDDGKLVFVPRVQAIWNQYDADTVYDEDADTRINAHDVSGVSTRLGARLYGAFSLSDEQTLKPFIEMNWLRIPDHSGIAINDRVVSLNTNSDLAEIKLGVSGRLAAQWDVWAQVSTQFSSCDDRAFGGTMGMKYSW